MNYHLIQATVLNNFSRTTWLLALFIGLMITENICKYQEHSKRSLGISYSTNFLTLIFNDVVMSLLSVMSLIYVVDQLTVWRLSAVVPNQFAQLMITLLTIDFMLYWMHRVSHASDTLWIFHRVHHSDNAMNTSTAFRLNAVEALAITVVKIMVILITGISMDILLITETVISSAAIFHHANISFKGEKFLGQVFITPSLHRTHHSTKRTEHDSNYGHVFSIWDSMLNTRLDSIPLNLGLSGVQDQTFKELMKYGLTTIKPVEEPMSTEPQYSLEHMIAEAAYYRALNRGFAHGDDFGDWFKAEQEIKRQYQHVA